MTYGEDRGFYAYTGEVGEPTVIGHVSCIPGASVLRADHCADRFGQD